MFLVFPLILAVLSTGQSNAQVTSSLCQSSPVCPADYEMEKEPCLYNRDVECDCKKGFYSKSGYHHRKDCQPCPHEHHNGGGAGDDSVKWQRCLEEPECQRKCIPLSSTIPNPTITSFETPSATTTTASAISTSASNSTDPVKTPVPPSSAYPSFWLFLAVLVAIFLALSLLLLLFTRNPCPCWRVNKALEPPVEDPIFSDQRSHQGSSPTTLILNISEETPMMPLSQSPAPSEYPAHIGPVLLDTEHKAARQGEPLEHWPAIVLYAIIKEVPLRRWKEFLRLLSVADQQLERVELEAGLGLGSMERQYQMLRLWSQRSTSSLNDVFSALHYMDLSGCAQLLQENLEKLQ
ncbi:tumor necrosis factor receptor superfamily member 1A [Pagrus major]|uniref:tumor necrosis factor receptor superfamily member 1A n=1 Tax=Pagrus major TaxID=143350 RepID=UPI003CC85A27